MPFTAPTQRPDEPVTAGVDVGPGVGSEALRSTDQRLNLVRMLEEDGSEDALYLRQVAIGRGWI